MGTLTAARAQMTLTLAFHLVLALSSIAMQKAAPLRCA